MTGFAWRQLRKSWNLPLTGPLVWQTLVAGSLFSALNFAQAALTVRRRQSTSLSGSIIILGYWRSGTTLLHDYLARDRRFGFPTTYACMHPQHFILTHAAAMSRPQPSVRRPMDDVRVYPSSPQEDEFGLLALGARSPYEALLAPCNLAEALALCDPRNLSMDEQKYWEQTFNHFLQGVSVVQEGRPLILKSPSHGYRVATLRRLLPDARFILIVRSPDRVFESAVRMWRSLFQVYALGAIPSEEETRRIVLADRPRFEAKLTEGLAGLPEENLAVIRYEELVQDPRGVVGHVYEQLRLGDFSNVEKSIELQHADGRQYTASNASPPEYWMEQVRRNWRSIYSKYGYQA